MIVFPVNFHEFISWWVMARTCCFRHRTCFVVQRNARSIRVDMNQAKEKKASRADIASHRPEMAKEAIPEILASGTTLSHCHWAPAMVSGSKSRDKHDCHWAPAMALLKHLLPTSLHLIADICHPNVNFLPHLLQQTHFGNSLGGDASLNTSKNQL